MVHPIQQKLEGSILRRLSGRKKIERHFDYVTYVIYQYSHEGLLILAGVGISHPLITLFSEEQQSTQSGDAAAASLFEVFRDYPRVLLAVVGIAFLAWFVVRLRVTVEGLTDRVPLYRACQRELGRVESDLEEALGSANPMGEVVRLQVEAKQIVDRYHAEGAWPWPIAPPGIDDDVKRRAQELSDRYGNNWPNPPPVDQA